MITKKEVIRYLGYGKNLPDEKIDELIDKCIQEVEDAAEPKCIYLRYPLQMIDEQTIQVAGVTFTSRNLVKNLKGCEEVYILAATLGASVDRLLHRYLKIGITKAAIIQAAAAAAIEDYCNDWQKQRQVDLQKEQLFLRPRYSPGYGDLALSCQSEFLKILNAEKTVGIILSEGDIMIPEKSVTAFAGISKVNSRCHLEGCEVCDNVNCAFRRN